MKLIIQIPCYNEEETLPITLADLPTEINGIDVIEVLIIDDGSQDRTVAVARELGVNHIVHHNVNKGLAVAFQSGLTAAISLGADIIVNTDGDNQYPGRFISDLVEPIIAGRADMVIGDRQTGKISHFSPRKKMLQNWGSAVVRYVSQTDVPDAPSGFRALSQEAALHINIFSDYTYTLETIIQAGIRNLTIAHIKIETNPQMRESRLIRSIPTYVFKSTITILRLFALYKPFKTFFYIALPFLLVGGVLWLRFLILLILGEAERGSNVQSVIFGAALLMMGFLIGVFGLLGELIAVNRRLHEETLYYLKRISLTDDNRLSANPALEPTGDDAKQQLDANPEQPM
jgi:glycosyltransferase involved in cell wall biosynthesis